MSNRNIDINIPKEITPYLDAAFTFVALQSTCNSKYSSGFDKFAFKKRFSDSIKENTDFSFKASEDELRMILQLTKTLLRNQQFMTPREREEKDVDSFSQYIDQQVKHFKMLFINSHF